MVSNKAWIGILIMLALLIVSLSAIQFFISSYKAGTERPVCGNGVCDFFETPEQCCIDCGCYGQTEICNKEKNRCEIKLSKLSNEEVKKLIEDYYKKKFEEGSFDFELQRVEEIENFNCGNKVGKRALVIGIHHPEDGEPFEDYGTALVSDDGTVKHIEHAGSEDDVCDKNL